LYRALASVRDQLRDGTRDFARLTADARVDLERAGLRPEYVEIRRQEDLAAADAGTGERRIVLAAARLGRARLIDNLLV
jgi:pantoate--beta-alanine ligase